MFQVPTPKNKKPTSASRKQKPIQNLTQDQVKQFKLRVKNAFPISNPPMTSNNSVSNISVNDRTSQLMQEIIGRSTPARGPQINIVANSDIMTVSETGHMT